MKEGPEIHTEQVKLFFNVSNFKELLKDSLVLGTILG